MQISSNAIVNFWLGVALLVGADSVAAQEWSIGLYDITIDDETLDQIRAEPLEFLPDGKTVVTAGHFYDGMIKDSFGEIRLRNVKDGSLKKALRGNAVNYAFRAGTLAISPDGKRIAASGRDNNNQYVIDVFDTATEKLICTLWSHNSIISWLAFSPDGKSLAAAHLMKGTIDLWDHKTGKRMKSFDTHKSQAWSIAYTPDGKFLAVGNAAGSVTFHNAKTGKQMGEIDLKPGLSWIGAIAFSPDGKSMAVGGSSEPGAPSPIFLCEWNVSDTDAGNVKAKVKTIFKGHRHHTYSVVFSPNGNLLASANQDRTARVWDLRTNKHFSPIPHNDFVYDVAFSPKGTSLATLSRDMLTLWTIEELRKAK